MTIWIPDLPTGRPRYVAIAEAMKTDLLRGVLKAGDRLPTHRDLAYRLGVTTGTVTRAYAEAEKAGAYCAHVVPALLTLREACDAVEAMVTDSRWPLPRYREMLFLS